VWGCGGGRGGVGLYGGGQVSGQGTAQWARKAGGTGDDYAHSVAATATGAVVVVGRTSSTTLHCQELRVARASEPFESYTDPEDAMDAFTLSLDGNGVPSWGRADGGRNHDAARVRAHVLPSASSLLRCRAIGHNAGLVAISGRCSDPPSGLAMVLLGETRSGLTQLQRHWTTAPQGHQAAALDSPA
jgi:hypothetical protein